MSTPPADEVYHVNYSDRVKRRVMLELIANDWTVAGLAMLYGMTESSVEMYLQAEHLAPEGLCIPEWHCRVCDGKRSTQ